MEDLKNKIKNVVVGLTKLVEFVPKTETELDQWYEQKNSFLNEVDFPEGLRGPGFLYYYLADADIRLKEEEYAEWQNRRVKSLLQLLNQGVIPTDKEIVENEKLSELADELGYRGGDL